MSGSHPLGGLALFHSSLLSPGHPMSMAVPAPACPVTCVGKKEKSSSADSNIELTRCEHLSVFGVGDTMGNKMTQSHS